MLTWVKSLGRLRERQPTVQRRSRGLADLIKLELNGLRVLFRRKLSFAWPHEVHILVPRAEFIKTYQNGRLVEERTVLSSISIVHAPYHPPVEGGGPPGLAPAQPTLAPKWRESREKRQEIGDDKEKL